jgi:peptidoglycan/LPS O-acetylase OafA/YrhL
VKFFETKPEKKHWLDVWHVSPSANRDYDFIDGLRGIAILMVLAGHHFYVNPNSGQTVKYIGSLIGTGGYGVTLFFALSGFLISWPFWKRKVIGSKQVVPSGYAQRRFWKIYPPLALSILVFTPIYIFRNSDWSYVSIAAQWLIGLPFLFPVSGKLNPVMWTLVIEVQFYITLPLLLLVLKRIAPKTCLWIVTLCFLLVPISMRIAIGHGATFHPDINTYFPAALDAFCLGILIAGLENLGVLKKKWAWLGVAGIILWPLSLLAATWLNFHPESKSFTSHEIVEGLIKMAACFVSSPTLNIRWRGFYARRGCVGAESSAMNGIFFINQLPNGRANHLGLPVGMSENI